MSSPAAPATALAYALFEQSPFSSVIYDATGRLVAVNAAFRAMWGVGIETAPPDYSVLADPELERLGALPAVRRAFAGEAVVTPPIRYDIARVSTSGAGRRIWTQGHFFPLRDAAGTLTHVVLVHADITEQVEAQERLRESEERVRLAQRAARIGVFDWEVQTGRVTWTEEEERLFGLAPGAFEGNIAGWGARVLDEDRVRMEREMGEAMARRERDMSFAFRIRRLDGEVRHLEGSGSFFYAPDGTPLRMVGVNVDVTERVRAVERLTESERQVRAAQHVARLGGWRWDVVTNRLSWDDTACELYGVRPATAPRDFDGYLALVHPDDREWARDIAMRAMADGNDFAFDHRVLRDDGSVRYLHGRGELLRGPSGEIVAMAGSTQDVTERKEGEAELARLLESERQARAEAEAANRAKSDFLAKMSHELRTPLNAIAGYAELLEIGVHGPVTAPQRDALERIQRNQRHLLALINDILDFSKIEVGAVRLTIADVPAAEIVQSLEPLIAPQLRARGVWYDALPVPAGLVVRADRERVVQVCLNLLSNALKATPAGGRVAVSCEARGARVAIGVHDTGGGIAPDQLEAIFSPFTQIGRTYSNPGAGVGLGLAISRELARAMGGELTVESLVGAGSTFTLELPAPE